VTTTDAILALATAAGAAVGAAAPGPAPVACQAPAVGPAPTVTEEDLTAFRAAALRGAGSAVVRALLAIRPAGAATWQPPRHTAPPPTSSPGDPAWTAWLTTAAAIAGEANGAGEGTGVEAGAGAGEGAVDADGRAARTSRHVWCAVFGAAVALADWPGGDAPAAAVSAGLRAAATVESGLNDWGGWSSGSVAATVGAGVTAGLLLGLSGPRLRAVIGICATQAAGLRAAAGTDAFPLQMGKAAFNGVEAALLAQAGVTAPAEPLDGRRGLFALFG